MDANALSFVALCAGTIARWRAIIAVTVGTMVVALVLTLVLPPTWRATTSFVTAGASGQVPLGLADLASEPGLAGMASQLGLGSGRDPSISPAFYTQLLDSRELLTRIIQSRFADPRAPGDSATLLQIYRIGTRDSAKAMELAVRKLRRSMRVGYDSRTNLVVVNVDARWPDLSAEIANRAVKAVSAFNKEQRFTRARAKREFLEGRVQAAQKELRDAEDSLEQLYARNRLWASSPALVVEERRRRNQVETANAIYASLRQQYETARIDEVNDTPVITVVDPAIPPKQREWPHRALILVTAGILGAALGVFVAGTGEISGHWARHNPDQAELLRAAGRRAVREIAGTLSGAARKQE